MKQFFHFERSRRLIGGAAAIVLALSILCLSVVVMRAPLMTGSSTRHLSKATNMDVPQAIDAVFLPALRVVEPAPAAEPALASRSRESVSLPPQAPVFGAASLRSPPSV